MSDFSDTDVCKAVVIYESITRSQAPSAVAAAPTSQFDKSNPRYWEERLPGVFVCEYGKSRTN